MLNRCANQSTAIVGENAWSFIFTSRVFKHLHVSNFTHGMFFFLIFDVLKGRQLE